jgi:hypothetical protein
MTVGVRWSRRPERPWRRRPNEKAPASSPGGHDYRQPKRENARRRLLTDRSKTIDIQRGDVHAVTRCGDRPTCFGIRPNFMSKLSGAYPAAPPASIIKSLLLACQRASVPRIGRRAAPGPVVRSAFGRPLEASLGMDLPVATSQRGERQAVVPGQSVRKTCHRVRRTSQCASPESL